MEENFISFEHFFEKIEEIAIKDDSKVCYYPTLSWSYISSPKEYKFTPEEIDKTLRKMVEQGRYKFFKGNCTDLAHYGRNITIYYTPDEYTLTRLTEDNFFDLIKENISLLERIRREIAGELELKKEEICVVGNKIKVLSSKEWKYFFSINGMEHPKAVNGIYIPYQFDGEKELFDVLSKVVSSIEKNGKVKIGATAPIFYLYEYSHNLPVMGWGYEKLKIDSQEYKNTPFYERAKRIEKYNGGVRFSPYTVLADWVRGLEEDYAVWSSSLD